MTHSAVADRPRDARCTSTTLGKLKLQIFCRKQTNCILVASIFVIHPQILIFSVFKISNLSPYSLQIEFSMSLFYYSFTLAINLCHRKFVTADVTAVFVNNQHDIKRRLQDCDKKFVFELVQANRLTDEFPKKSWF